MEFTSPCADFLLMFCYSGVQILEMMRIMAANIDERVVELWDEVIPKLIAYIEANRGDWKQTNWEASPALVSLLS